MLTFFDFLTVIQVQSPICKSPQQIQVFMFKVIWLPSFHSLNAQTHPICTDASTIILYRLVPVHDQIKCLMTNINMTFELTVAPCCVKSPWWYYWFNFVASLLLNMPLFYSFTFRVFIFINWVNILYQKLVGHSSKYRNKWIYYFSFGEAWNKRPTGLTSHLCTIAIRLTCQKYHFCNSSFV